MTSTFRYLKEIDQFELGAIAERRLHQVRKSLFLSGITEPGCRIDGIGPPRSAIWQIWAKESRYDINVPLFLKD